MHNISNQRTTTSTKTQTSNREDIFLQYHRQLIITTTNRQFQLLTTRAPTHLHHHPPATGRHRKGLSLRPATTSSIQVKRNNQTDTTHTRRQETGAPTTASPQVRTSPRPHQLQPQARPKITRDHTATNNKQVRQRLFSLTTASPPKQQNSRVATNTRTATQQPAPSTTTKVRLRGINRSIHNSSTIPISDPTSHPHQPQFSHRSPDIYVIDRTLFRKAG